MSDDPRIDLVGDHLLEGVSASSELRALSTLPREKQEAVLSRLEVIDRYLRIDAPRAEDAQKAADDLGMQQRNFYRLVDKLRRHGPVAGLARGYRTRRPPSAADGLGDVADDAIFDLLADHPTASLSEVRAAVIEACKRKGSAAPSDAAIRRRLNALRSPAGASELAADDVDRIFGRSVLLDQTALSLPVQTPDGPSLAVGTFIVDVGTRLILGLGFTPSKIPGASLKRAVEDVEARQGTLATGSFPISEVLEELHWVVPNGLEDKVEQWARNMALNDILGSFSARGERRHGQRLLRLLGAKFGGYELMPRLTGSPQIKRKGLPPPVDAARAAALLAGAVDDWNYEIVRAHQKAHKGGDPDRRARDLTRWRNLNSRLQRMGPEIRDLFRVVLPT